MDQDVHSLELRQLLDHTEGQRTQAVRVEEREVQRVLVKERQDAIYRRYSGADFDLHRRVGGAQPSPCGIGQRWIGVSDEHLRERRLRVYGLPPSDERLD